MAFIWHNLLVKWNKTLLNTIYFVKFLTRKRFRIFLNIQSLENTCIFVDNQKTTMRFTKHLATMCISCLLLSCGGDKKKEKKNEIKIGDKKEKKEVKISDNQGIGPIKDFTFNADINQELVQKGEAIFKAKCTACHMTTKKLIGPAIKGTYDRRNPTWVMNLLLNPDQMLNEDPDAKALLDAFNNVRMLDQKISEEQAIALSEYMRSL